jgi:hypothetical protein
MEAAMSDPTRFEDHPFGEAVPGEAVAASQPQHFMNGYQERGRFVRSALTGRKHRVDQLRKDRPVTTAILTPTPQPMPASAMTVYDCIVAVSTEIAKEGISKSRSNQQQQYKFRGIDDVLNALSPLLAKYRLVIMPRILSRSVVERTTQKGGVLFYVTVEAEFDFVSAADGSMHTVKTYGEAMDSADKATNKAMSAAYKYAAFQTFCIPTEGDTDADAVTHDVRPAFVPVRRVEISGRSHEGPDLGTAEPDDLPDGFRLIDDYKLDGDWHHVYWGRDAQGGTMVYKTKLAKIGLEAHNAFTERMPVLLHSKKYPYLDKVEKLGITREQIAASKFQHDDPAFCAGCGMPTPRCEC